MLTSKGAAGVTGSGFIVLASTLSALRVVPVEGVALVLGRGPLHERGARDHEPDRQRRGDAGHCAERDERSTMAVVITRSPRCAMNVRSAVAPRP